MIENQEIGFTKGSKSGMESCWPFSWYITCLEPLLGSRVLKEIFFLCLGLTATEINKKLQKQEKKKI